MSENILRGHNASQPVSTALAAIGTRRTILIYALLFFLAVLPLAFTQIPFLVDFPNHLARLYVMANAGHDAALDSNYDVVWGVLPNLALEIVTFPLMKILPVEIVGRLFILLIFGLLVGGTLTLRRVLHGRFDLMGSAVFLFLYKHLLIMGFVNYLFSLGLALFLFAGWIASGRMPAAIRLALFSAAAFALFFCHLFALAVYAVCVGAYEIGRHYRDLPADPRAVAAKWLYGALQFAPVAMLIAATMPHIHGHELLYGTFAQKLRAAWSPTLTYQTPLDLAILLFVAGVLALGLIRRKLVLAPQLRVPLLFLVPLAAAMPFWVRGAWGSVAYSDLRLPLAVMLLLVAGLGVRNVKRETLFAVACAATVLFGARVLNIAEEWRRADLEFSEFRAASAVIPKGAALLPVQIRDAYHLTGVSRFEYAYWHLATLTVIDRSAFVPFLFTDPAKQPIRATPRRQKIDVPFGAPITYRQLEAGIAGNGEADLRQYGDDVKRSFWADWPANYDYVLVTDFGVRGNPAPGFLTPVHEGSFFTIYKVASTINK